MIKAYTDLKQSEDLMKYLPISSADMYYEFDWDLDFNTSYKSIPIVIEKSNHFELYSQDIPCWSLAALLDILPKIHGLKPVLDLEENSIQYSGIDLYIVADNPVDACYEMIVKLHEQKLI